MVSLLCFAKVTPSTPTTGKKPKTETPTSSPSMTDEESLLQAAVIHNAFQSTLPMSSCEAPTKKDGDNLEDKNDEASGSGTMNAASFGSTSKDEDGPKLQPDLLSGQRGVCCECGFEALLGVNAHRPEKNKPRLRHDVCRNRRQEARRHLFKVTGSHEWPFDPNEMRSILHEAKSKDLSNEQLHALMDKKIEHASYEKEMAQMVKEELPASVWQNRGYTIPYLEAHCLETWEDPATNEHIYKMQTKKEVEEQGNVKECRKSLSSGSSTETAKQLLARAKAAAKSSAGKAVQTSAEDNERAKACNVQKKMPNNI